MTVQREQNNWGQECWDRTAGTGTDETRQLKKAVRKGYCGKK
jgi:hypothetical protein